MIMNSKPIPAETSTPDLSTKKSSPKWFTYLVPAATLLGLALLGSYFYISGNTQALAQVPAEKSTAQDKEKAKAEKVSAPDFEGGVAWLNTAKPISIKDLKGKIVLLDFWTLCCINCIHTLPDLAKLEKKYANELVVIGVHSAKFENEKETESIRKAIARYEIKHPVVNDANMKIWRTYGVNSWPTLVLLDSEGNFVAKGSGEGLHDAVDLAIAKLVKSGRENKTLNEKPIDFGQSVEKATSPLYFPGKVLADAESKRVFIADSTNHRVIITDLEGKALATIGQGGKPGFKNGSYTEAMFDDPQGMALVGDDLYLADRKNHLVRKIDLKKQTVSTAAGTGKQGHDRDTGGIATLVGLNSPWDLLRKGDTLFIALAGHHQIWTLDIKFKKLLPYAGNGRETLKDNPLASSSFAQPSGLTTDGTNLFVADSEISAIRSLPLDGKGNVKTIVGLGLFDFGDIDGFGDEVRIQHALGVAWHQGLIYIADTYNSKIKTLDPKTRECKNYLSSTKTGWMGGPMFNEPAGINISGGMIYIADTNAHRIQVVDLKTKAVSTLKITGVDIVPR
jgi:thiol-disulfide isomerase/thioredoxin